MKVKDIVRRMEIEDANAVGKSEYKKMKINICVLINQ
jgi:hypothetical protein